MLAARVEQKNEQTRCEKMVCTTLDKESPIQAVCGKAARTDLCGGREVTRVPTATGLFESPAIGIDDPSLQAAIVVHPPETLSETVLIESSLRHSMTCLIVRSDL